MRFTVWPLFRADSAMRAVVRVFSYEYGDVETYSVNVFPIRPPLWQMRGTAPLLNNYGLQLRYSYILPLKYNGLVNRNRRKNVYESTTKKRHLRLIYNSKIKSNFFVKFRDHGMNVGSPLPRWVIEIKRDCHCNALS